MDVSRMDVSKIGVTTDSSDESVDGLDAGAAAEATGSERPRPSSAVSSAQGRSSRELRLPRRRGRCSMSIVRRQDRDDEGRMSRRSRAPLVALVAVHPYRC